MTTRVCLAAAVADGLGSDGRVYDVLDSLRHGVCQIDSSGKAIGFDAPWPKKGILNSVASNT